MTEVLQSAFAVQKRGGRWCLIHVESGIMHERNFSHKGMAKLFGMELTESGFVPEGADRVKDILAEEVEKAEKHKEALARMEEKAALQEEPPFHEDAPEKTEPAQKAPKKYKKRRKKNK